MRFNRYLILGLSGVGKSPLAARLGERLNTVPYSMSTPLREMYPNKTPIEYAKITKELLNENPNFFIHHADWACIYEGIRNPYDFVQLITRDTLIIYIWPPWSGWDNEIISEWERIGLQKIREIMNSLTTYTLNVEQRAPITIHTIYRTEQHMNLDLEVGKILALGDSILEST